MSSKEHEAIAPRKARFDEGKRALRAECKRDFPRPVVAVALKATNNKMAART